MRRIALLALLLAFAAAVYGQENILRRGWKAGVPRM